eukprot:scaffold242906_cov22-Tisochrysis_lutea.AAC.1
MHLWERSQRLTSTSQDSINLSCLETGAPSVAVLKQAQANDEDCRALTLALFDAPLPQPRLAAGCWP